MKAVFALALCLALTPICASARCLSYEPAIVNLVGELRSAAFPGPPNYVSIAGGDYPETVFILKLDQPICVSGDPSSKLNSKSHSDLTEIQVVVAPDKVRSLLGKRVRASGTLFGAQSGHHRTPALLQVSSIRDAG
jgi:hypothetical protein